MTPTLNRAGIRWAMILPLLVLAGASQAADIPVPNGSFEAPATGFVDTRIDLWTKSPQPVWFDPATAGIGWDQLSGVFANTAPGTATHIDNVHLNQAIYVFGLPTVGISQELTGLEGSYQVGMSYQLTIGLVGGGGGLPEGAGFLLGFYYRDGANQAVPIGSTVVSYSTTAFPTTTHLVDHSVQLPAVQSGDAWAGKAIGIELSSISGTGAGYWDVDNVRLSATQVPEPGTLALGGLGFGAFLLAQRWLRRRA
jgi:hypothetical protein